ncbi:MAG: GNAT family N-acetyltransferase [Betaproteobacteria bacterium]|nr:MAG: GNAT family N-acetyltransferase [Betaproteobacteria bacterium]
MKPDLAVTVRTANWERDQHVLRSIREAVFVHEQKVPAELEWDGLDPDCAHVIAYADSDKAVATGRLLPDGHIGRIAVLKSWRRRGVGSRVLQALIEIARAKGMANCALNAQTHALSFYERYGFIAEGEEFDEAGIPHQHMVLKR